jgi:HEPN domain
MKIDNKVIEILDGLINEGEAIRESGHTRTTMVKEYHFNIEDSTRWHTKLTSLVSRVFKNDSEYYQNLKSFDEDAFLHTNFQRALGILKAAKDDYENGYLFNTRTLIEAEIFDDLLEQSEHLLNQGYFQAAAVIAGSVLEDALRKLCDKNSIPLPPKATINPMNSELAKANVYNLLKQKQITALADLRNKAAHNQGGFTKEDVEDMIRNVRRFMEDYFS